MNLSSTVLRFLAKKTKKKVSCDQVNALEDQSKIFASILGRGSQSLFAKEHSICSSLKYLEFNKRVPLSSYEDYKKYITLISQGKKNILTSGLPSYFAISSGTTSGTKYIPLTKEMMKIHTRAVAELLLLYSYQKNNYQLSLNSAMMFIQGSPELQYLNKIPFGKLSGISARHVPLILQKFRYPSMKTNSIKDWEIKIKKIVEETHNKNLRILGGIPPWVMTYFNALLKYTNKTFVKDVFPKLDLYIHGGASFDPYKKRFLNVCGPIDTLEVYPASEGFFGYQNNIEDPSLMLLTNHGVFYEFICLKDFRLGRDRRIPLEGVQLNIDYVLVVSTISGLWAYNTGDTIRFVSKKPYKILFSGRATQFCSAFGEHVIESEVQNALMIAIKECGGVILEFTVAPKINNSSPSLHEWFIEFNTPPVNLSDFEFVLNNTMMRQNIYYADLIKSNVLQPLKVKLVKRGGFHAYMKSIGKFGGQNKCPHLSNNRNIVEFLIKNYV